jgi:hypothetical protein
VSLVGDLPKDDRRQGKRLDEEPALTCQPSALVDTSPTLRQQCNGLSAIHIPAVDRQLLLVRRVVDRWAIRILQE